MHWRSLVLKFDSKQKAMSSYSDDRVDALQLRAQIALDFTDVREHLIRFNRLKRRVHRCHRQHSSSKGGAKVVLFNRGADSFIYKAGTDRNATTQGLCQGNDIRHDTVACLAPRKEPVSGATNAGLHLVKDQKNAALITKVSQLQKKFRVRRRDARHRLNRLQHDCRDALGRKCLYRVDVAKFGLQMARNVGLSNFAILAKESR